MNNQINLFRSLIDHGRLVLRLMMERRVPLYLKLLPLAAVAYLIWPLDFLPDLMPFLGQLDDLAALLVGLEAFVALGAWSGVWQLWTGTFAPPVSDLEPLGLTDWRLPALWLLVSVAVPATVALLAAW